MARLSNPAPGIPLDSPVSRFLLDPLGTIAHWASSHGGATALALKAGAAALLVGLVLAGLRLGLGRWRSARLRQDARQVEILSPPSVDPAGAEALWRNLHGLLRWRRRLLGRPHIAWEYRWAGERLAISLWVPGPVSARLVARAVEAAWPGARARIDHQPSTPLPERKSVRGGVLRLAGPDWWSVRTDHDQDPLRALLSVAAERREGEAVLVQVLARPASSRRLARCRKVARALRRGQSLSGIGRLLDLIGPGTRGMLSTWGHDPDRPAQVREILAKAADPGWEVLLRYGVAAGDRDGRRAVRLAHGITGAFVAYAGRNQFVRRRLGRPARALETRGLRRGDLLSVAELAGLCHLPWDLSVPGVARAGARSVAPAPGVPATGKVLGDADAGGSRPVAITPADARHHLHVLGATGSGKSTLLARLVLQDVQAGRGAMVIDPRGDLIRDVLDRLPKRAIGRTVLLDPDEQDAPPTLNMLEGQDAELAVEHVVEVFRRVFARAWGPRTDDVLRSACLTLLRHGPATLADVPRLLSDQGFRERLTAGLDDPAGLSGFWNWYQDLTPAGQAQVVGPALSRLRAVLLRGFARDVLGQTASSFDLAEVLDGGMLLARLPKGVLGDDTSRLLGSFVVAKTWQAALERARAGEHARVDATLYIDEAHNFLHLPYRYEEMLTEARGYRLGLVLAHQHLDQLPTELREAAAANARTKVYFTVSPDDARHLEPHVAPELGAHDLSHLGVWQAAVRPFAGGQELPACTIRTRPLGAKEPGRAEAVRAAARKRYGRTAAQRRRATLKRGLGSDQTRIRRRTGTTPERRPSS
ncbi:MAG TPA: type IV secretion system DNA-binding domain-containing protein [Actinomycetes bacterium]|nr:type IV secretion system DNA-binding domain-containing protein [Actinomycetes bacterium]